MNREMLSARGSRIFPKSLTSLRRRATHPSKASVSSKERATPRAVTWAQGAWPETWPWRKAQTNTGARAIRDRVRRLAIRIRRRGTAPGVDAGGLSVAVCCTGRL